MTTAPAALARASARDRFASVSAAYWLAGIVTLSFALRVAASIKHAAPRIFPDEYIYASLGRAIGKGSLSIRGEPAGFPALLEPIAAAPLWALAGGDLELGYRLVQGMHAFVVSLAAVPVFLLARRLQLSPRLALGCAFLTLMAPVLAFTPYVMADSVALPLALGALAVGTAAAERPSRRSQAAFVLLAGLATFARIQYVVLVPAFLVAALVVSGGDVRRAARDFRITLALLALPVAAAAVAGPSRALGYYDTVTALSFDPVAIGRWLATDAMLLAYAAGWVLVPGALVGLALGVARPRSRAERAFSALAGSGVVLLLAEASVYAANGSERFQERYLAAIVPLAPLCFCLGARRFGGRGARAATALVAGGLFIVAAIVPLSTYAEQIGFGEQSSRQDSPLLWAVHELGGRIGLGDASLLVGLVAGVLAVVAAASVLSGRRATPIILTAAGVVLVITSLGAVRYDIVQSERTTLTIGDVDQSWIDHARVGEVAVLQTPYASRQQISSQLFWNTSLTEILRMDRAAEVDSFGSRAVTVGRDGAIVADGAAVTRPLLVEEYASWAVIDDARLVRRTVNTALWVPHGQARLALLQAGRYFDGMLSAESTVTIWPRPSGRRQGTLELRLRLPAGVRRAEIDVTAPSLRRTVTVEPGGSTTLRVPVVIHAPWTVKLRAREPYFASGGRLVAALSDPPRLVETGRSNELSAVKASGESADN